MFHRIPPEVRTRMAELEAIDARDRVDGTDHLRRLRQIPPETGRFLALMAAAAPEGAFLEIGASAGYSSLWLGLACRARGARLVTFEVLPEKAALAQETIAAARMEAVIELVPADARQGLAAYDQVAFCFLDAEKEHYQEYYALVVPKLVPGGLFVADNVTSHAEDLRPFVERALADPDLDALVVPLGKGLLVGRRAGWKDSQDG